MTMWTRRTLLAGLAATPIIAPRAHASDIVSTSPIIEDVTLTHANERVTAVRLITPGQTRNARLGVVVFSHGANSNGALYDRLLAPIAEAGFMVVAPTHVDAETNPDRAKYNPDSVLETRLSDIRLASDSIADLARIAKARINPRHVAIAGHSYGALLALYMVGAGFRARGAPVDSPANSIRDARFKCALAVSPPGPLPNFLVREQFDTIATPIMVTTGEKDVLPGFVNDWRDRLIAYERSPTKPAYAVVSKEADHYFGGEIGRFNVPGPKTPSDLAITTALSAQFLRAFAKNSQRDARALRFSVANPPTTPAPAIVLARY
jgi:poly(3-hydroxybutyrate) depolymerase